MRFLTGIKLKRITGADLFIFEMQRLNKEAGRCFFLGSSESTLLKITKRAAIDFPNVKIYTYSPPFKSEFSSLDNARMIKTINECKPNVLFVGMTAPKQEKWSIEHINELEVEHLCCIGAVFDFYAGTINRAPNWMRMNALEWFYRLFKEPKRLWRRYIFGNIKFIGFIIKEKYINNSSLKHKY
jgi:N-acetylglucosaminyldiphosphoundecaprenol N-acetyl-beta-D-mannosaminyltransferase